MSWIVEEIVHLTYGFYKENEYYEYVLRINYFPDEEKYISLVEIGQGKIISQKSGILINSLLDLENEIINFENIVIEVLGFGSITKSKEYNQFIENISNLIHKMLRSTVTNPLNYNNNEQ